MANKVEANIKPELLVWARESAGLEISVVAKKMGQISDERLQSWERGEKRPTVKQLRKLARIYKRPLAIFYLPEPPRDFQPMHDFRRVYGEVSGIQSPELRYQIRKAHNRREIALELFAIAELSVKQFQLEATLSDNPEKLGIVVRESVGIRFDDQIRWSQGYDAFNHWRGALENAGVLVFQITDVEVAETRGFSISESPLPAIAVNVKDSPSARIFSMLHELCHIMLKRGGLCDIDEHTGRGYEEQQIEVFCNSVAGASLVPMDLLLNEELVKNKSSRSNWADKEIQTLANRYAVSQEMLLRRLLTAGRISENFYRTKRAQFQREYEDWVDRREASQGEKRGPQPYILSLSSSGHMFVRLVLDNYHQDKITISDVSDFLDLRLKHLHKIEAAVLPHPSQLVAAS